MNQVKIGFKRSIDINKIILWFSVCFYYDRKNNDRVEITSMEKKYITTLMITPIIGAVIVGAWGLIDPTSIYKFPISLKKRNWQILF